MEILIVTKNYHPLVGGVETQARLVAHRLAERHNVEVVATTFRQEALPRRLRMLEDSVLQARDESYVDGPVRVHALGPTASERLRMAPMIRRILPRQHRRYLVRRRAAYRHYRSVYVPKLRQLIRGRDVVHCLSYHYLGWAAQEAALAEDVPFVLTPYVHVGQYGDDVDSVAFYNRSDIVFALLETDRESLIGLGVDPALVRLAAVVPLLPESSDPADFRRRHGLRDEPVILYLGRLETYKGAAALLEATSRVWPEVPTARFFFAGQEGDASLALAQAGDERVVYLGLVSEQEKADALAACDLFCMPSTFEILPAVYLEAWSYGKAVVGGTAHGLRELIEGNDAGIVGGHDPADIARRLVELLEDDDLRHRMGERGRALVEERFSEEALVSALERAYEDVSDRERR
jgi:phosphatidyl-myo-inositol dimannoside synthase